MYISNLEKALGAVALVFLVLVVATYLLPNPENTIDLRPIVRLTKNGRTFCSGTVINSHTIVTAAHCVVQENPFEALTGPTLKDEIEIRENDNLPTGVIAKPY